MLCHNWRIVELVLIMSCIGGPFMSIFPVLFCIHTGEPDVLAFMNYSLYTRIEQHCQNCNAYISLSMKSSQTELNFKLHIKYVHLCKGFKTALLYKF
jgi:hypothetical protein